MGELAKFREVRKIAPPSSPKMNVKTRLCDGKGRCLDAQLGRARHAKVLRGYVAKPERKMETAVDGRRLGWVVLWSVIDQSTTAEEFNSMH